MGIEPQYVYLGATCILAILQLINMRKVENLKSEIESLWKQIAIMAIASAGAFDKVQKSLDEKEDKK
jgi:hypothetical protein